MFLNHVTSSLFALLGPAVIAFCRRGCSSAASCGCSAVRGGGCSAVVSSLRRFTYLSQHRPKLQHLYTRSSPTAYPSRNLPSSAAAATPQGRRGRTHRQVSPSRSRYSAALAEMEVGAAGSGAAPVREGLACCLSASPWQCTYLFLDMSDELNRR